MLPLTRRAGGVQAYKIIIRRAAVPTEPDPKTHEGYEWLYVLDGRLRLVLGEHDLVLTPGEAAEFDTRTAALVRAGRTGAASSSSACSASRASAPTCAPGPRVASRGSSASGGRTPGWRGARPGGA